MEGKGYLIHSARNLRASRGLVLSSPARFHPCMGVSKEQGRREKFRGDSLSLSLQAPAVSITSLTHRYRHIATFRRSGRRLSRPFLAKRPVFHDLARLLIAQRRRKHTHARAFPPPRIREAARGIAGEQSRFMVGPSIRGTLNLSQLTP